MNLSVSMHDKLIMIKELHKMMQEWPLKSTLDPKIYGPPESAITKELIEREIKGFMTFEEVYMYFSSSFPHHSPI